MLNQCPVNLQGRCRRPAEAADLVAILIRQVQKLLRRFHRLGGGDDDRLGEEIEPGFPVAGQADVAQQVEYCRRVLK
jgi:hypothetical protein